MAKLTESYLRSMIKQVMNEMHDMYDDSPAAINNAANEYDLGGLDSIEETAKRLGVNPMKLKAFIEQEQAQADSFNDMMGDDPNDYLAEARKRKLAQKRRVLKEGFMDKTLDFFGRKHEGGRGIRDRARELRDNPKWNGSNLARTYGKQIIQMINAGDNEAVTYADQLKDIEDQFKRQVGSEDELAGINAETKDSAQKRKDIYNNSIRNQNKRDSDKARNDKEYYGGLRKDNEEREFRGTPEYHDQFRKKVGDQYVAITPDKIKTRPDPRYKGS